MPSYPDLTREQLLDILSAVSETVIMIDGDLEVQYVNAPGMGYTDDDVRGTLAVDFLPPEHREAHTERLVRVLERGETESFEIPVLDPQGAIHWVEGTLTPMERDGQVVGVVSTSRNVTARHRAEEEADKLRSLVPICSWCGRIRSDEGFWREMESYVEEQADSRVTHGMCPDCEGRLRKSGSGGHQ